MTGKKKWIAIAGLFVVTFVLMFFYARQMRQNRMQKDIAKEILRLHVVANSDSKKDQALKMEVKEAIVTYLRGVMQDAESVDEARIQIQKRLPEIEAVAKEKMQQKGYSYDADATLSSCYFPVKTYGDMIFPAGEYEALKVKEQRIQEEIERVENTYVGTSSNINELLEEYGSTLLSGGSSLAELIRRPELNYKMLAEGDPKRPKLPEDVQEQVNINIKYDGYIKRQMKQVEQFKKMEEKKIPENINYDEIQSLRIEAKQKLNLYRPINIGQASRISGVSPADISVLLVYLGHK